MECPVRFGLGNIIIKFAWQGPSNLHKGLSQGELTVGAINLIFQNSKKEFSVNIPEGIDSTPIEKLPFICRRYHENVKIGGFKFLVQETKPEALKVTIEKILNLKLIAVLFEASPHKGNATLDKTGSITYDSRLLRSEREIQIQTPQELEEDQIYLLVVSSRNSVLSARLMKEEPAITISSSTQEEEAQLLHNRRELFQLIGTTLLTLVQLKTEEFAIRISNTSFAHYLKMRQQGEERTLATRYINEAIEKIDVSLLQQSLIEIRNLKSEWNSTSEVNRVLVERKIYKIAFDLLGAEVLAGIMRSTLYELILDDIPDGLKNIIDPLVTRFQDILMSAVNQ